MEIKIELAVVVISLQHISFGHYFCTSVSQTITKLIQQNLSSAVVESCS